MNITQRRLYMLSFVATFLLTAPVLVFLAKGYSFDRIGGVFVHNGAVIIKSNPKKVDLYLDGKKISNKMLNIINNYYVINGVRFGDHIIEAKKDGYTTWKKKIDVHSGVSTEFWNILLFPTKNTTLKTHSPKNVKRFYLSPRQDDELVLYKEEGEKEEKKIISTFTTNDSQEKVIYSTTKYTKLFPDESENVEWSSNHKKLLIPASIDQALLIEKKLDTDNSKTKTLASSTEKIIKKDYVILDLKNEEQSSLSLLDTLSTIDFSKLKNVNNEDSTKESMEITVANNKTITTTDQKLNNTDDSLDSRSKELTEKELPSTKENLSLNENTPEEISTPEIYQARWMFDSDHQILILTEDHKLFFIDIEIPSQSSLLAENVNGFDLAGDHVYYSNLSTNLIWDIKPNKSGYKQVVLTTQLKEETNSFVQLFAYDELRIALITSNNDLYILNKLKSEDKINLKLIEQNVFGVQFSDDGKKILYWTDKDFWVYMLRKWEKQPKREKGEKIFITNFASGINNVQWMEAYENVLFTNNNLIKSAELDNRDQINLSNILKINSTPKEKNYLYDKETSILYFLDAEKDDYTNSKLKSIKLLEQIGLFGFSK